MLGLSEEQFLNLVETVEMTGEQVRRRFIRYSDIAEIDFVGPPDMPVPNVPADFVPRRRLFLVGGEVPFRLG